jgi:D-arginine dehydrogenase
VAPLGLVAKRRTVIVVDAPAEYDTRAWPMVYELGERFYLKPESGRILASPADETPSPPCDCQPEEIDVALAVERIATATTLKIARIHRSWAGLRSFLADKCLAIGPARDQAGFYWLAGQGGYGIQTAPAAARIVAAQLRGEDPACVAPGVAMRDVLPERLAA